MFIVGRTAVAQAQLGDLGLCIGRPIVFHPEIAPPLPSDRLYPGPPDSAKRGVGGPTAFQLLSVHGEGTSKPLEIHIGERRSETSTAHVYGRQ